MSSAACTCSNETFLFSVLVLLVLISFLVLGFVFASYRGDVYAARKLEHHQAFYRYQNVVFELCLALLLTSAQNPSTCCLAFGSGMGCVFEFCRALLLGELCCSMEVLKDCLATDAVL